MPSSVSAELVLPAATASVPAARRFVRDTLASWGLDALVDAASLVVSELATNAVLHARSDFVVRLGRAQDGALRLEVVDSSARRPQPRSHGMGATTGRGLAIVDELVKDWGVEPTHKGKTVWVHLLAEDAVGDGTAARPDGRGGRGGSATTRPDGPVAWAA